MDVRVLNTGLRVLWFADKAMKPPENFFVTLAYGVKLPGEPKGCDTNPPIANIDVNSTACEGTVSGATCAYACEADLLRQVHLLVHSVSGLGVSVGRTCGRMRRRFRGLW